MRKELSLENPDNEEQRFEMLLPVLPFHHAAHFPSLP